MREQPWHHRRISSTDERWFQNLVDLNLLSQALETEFQLKQLSFDFQNTFETLLDDTHPEDLLGRMEQCIWTAQSSLLKNISINVTQKNRETIQEKLKYCAWHAGKLCAQRRWAKFPEGAKNDCRALLTAIHNLPFFGSGAKEPFLIKRVTQNEAQFTLLICPHEIPLSVVQPTAHTHCTVQMHWINGFLAHLNPQVEFQWPSTQPRPPHHCYMESH